MFYLGISRRARTVINYTHVWVADNGHITVAALTLQTGAFMETPTRTEGEGDVEGLRDTPGKVRTFALRMRD